MRHCLAFLLMVFILSIFTSCKHEDLDIYVESESYRNASDFIGNNYDLSLFHAALEQAGLLDMLKGEGPFTVFAPKNQAFNDLGIVRASDFSKMDQDSLRFMLQYHILQCRLYSGDVSENTIDNRHINLGGKELFVSRKANNQCPTCTDASVLYVNGAKSPKATYDVALANGVLHLTDKVLKYNEGTVQNTLEDRPEFALFVQMLKHFGEWDRLGGSGPFTVLAPTNDAFEKRGITTQEILQMEPTAYVKEMLLRPYILQNHVFTSDLQVYGYSNAGSLFGDTYVMMPVDGAEDYVSGIARVAGGNGIQPFVSEKTPPEIYKGYRRNTTFGSLWQVDHKSENGIVHAINDILVYPEDAVKE